VAFGLKVLQESLDPFDSEIGYAQGLEAAPRITRGEL
jgi:hypothetical protein